MLFNEFYTPLANVSCDFVVCSLGKECQCFTRYSLSLKKFPISMTIWHQKRRNGTKEAKGVRRSECHRIHLQMRLCALIEALGAHKSCLVLFQSVSSRVLENRDRLLQSVSLPCHAND